MSPPAVEQPMPVLCIADAEALGLPSIWDLYDAADSSPPKKRKAGKRSVGPAITPAGVLGRVKNPTMWDALSRLFPLRTDRPR